MDPVSDLHELPGGRLPDATSRAAHDRRPLHCLPPFGRFLQFIVPGSHMAIIGKWTIKTVKPSTVT